MPYALVIHCVSPSGTLYPEDLQGHKALALFLEQLIQTQDAALATQLHAPSQAKAFTTAILVPPSTRPRGPAPHAKAHETGRQVSEVPIRITLLDDTLYQPVSQFFLQHLHTIPLLRLGHAPLLVARVLTTPESGEPWAGCAPFATLLAQASTDDTAWSLQFVTPTVFKTGEADVPLPLPRLCFQSWLTSWDTHAPQPFFSDREARRAFLTEVVERGVSVTYEHIHMAHMPLYFNGVRTREQGFVGTCRFLVRPSHTAPATRKILATLAAYSYYAGTGRKTTMGMGLTRQLTSGGHSHGRSRHD